MTRSRQNSSKSILRKIVGDGLYNTESFLQFLKITYLWLEVKIAETTCALSLFCPQANSALAGLLEEDAVATEESKLIDNAWRGAEVGMALVYETYPYCVVKRPLF